MQSGIVRREHRIDKGLSGIAGCPCKLETPRSWGVSFCPIETTPTAATLMAAFFVLPYDNNPSELASYRRLR
ncbi:hypothetical protein Poly24_35570 [Rosistilla carotiformis]|uniref:Uncharacterized protein n=1 Tax=Rosistilla carotiformis TaxID=2528017 RepID=A0A518JWC6_9BACT|nr:hypothetical protein Poly24_35570 [Rosistilla carotiformis]